jgi:hypothetical protein
MPQIDKSQAEELVKKTFAQLMDFRAHCTKQMEDHQRAADFWGMESHTITQFLAENQLDGEREISIEDESPQLTEMYDSTLPEIKQRTRY